MPLLLQRMQRFALGHRAVAHSPQASRAIHPAWVVVLASAWLATACNVPLWREVAALPGQGTLRGWGFALAFAVIVAAGNAALLSVLAWRWTLKPAITAMLLLAAFGAYFMLAYGIAIDASMLVNVMQTDVKEAGDLLNWRMVSTVLALTAPPLLWLYRRPVRQMPAFRHMAHNGMLLVGSVVVIVVCLLLVFQDFASTMRNHTRLRYLINPLNSVYALGNIATKPLRLDTNTLMPLGRDAQLGVAAQGHEGVGVQPQRLGGDIAQRVHAVERVDQVAQPGVVAHGGGEILEHQQQADHDDNDRAHQQHAVVGHVPKSWHLAHRAAVQPQQRRGRERQHRRHHAPVQQITGLFHIGLHDVDQHACVDGNAVGQHEIGPESGQQQHRGDGGFERPAPGQHAQQGGIACRHDDRKRQRKAPAAQRALPRQGRHLAPQRHIAGSGQPGAGQYNHPRGVDGTGCLRRMGYGAVAERETLHALQ